MTAFVGLKKENLIVEVVDCSAQKTVAWVLGRRNTATFRRLYHKVKHLKDCIFYTDDWDAFAKVLPKKHHIIGKALRLLLSRITVIRVII